MIILLKLPTHKRVAANETKPLNAQKGPTCWYYASRLVREFHQLTSHWNPDANAEVEKAISNVRKFETRFDLILDKVGDRVPKETELNGIKGLLDDLMPKPIPVPEWLQMVKDFYAGGVQKGRDQLFDLMTTWNRFSKLGTSTSEGIWAKYGFTFQDGDMDPNTLSLRVWSWGPLLASGEFCAGKHGESEVSLAGDVTVRLTTQFESGDHVIVLCGVGILGERAAVFYHDPNYPAVCRAMYYDTYEARRNKKARLGMIPCRELNCHHVENGMVLNLSHIVKK